MYHNSNPTVKLKEFAGSLSKIVLFLLIFTFSVKSTNALASIVVIGEEKFPVAEAAHFLANHLELEEDVYILVIMTPALPDLVEGHTLFKDDTNLYGIKQATILISSTLSASRQLSVLGHEMAHVKQFVSGELTYQQDQCLLWKGKLWKNIDQVDYLDRPWEKEAIRMQYALAKLFKKGLSKRENIAMHTRIHSSNYFP